MEFLSGFGDFVYDFACPAGLKIYEEDAGCVFEVDEFHLYVHVHVCTFLLKALPETNIAPGNG